jgi:hypothetical protein
MQESVKLLLFVTAMALAAWLMLAWGKAYWKKRITRWADSRGFRLLEYRGAKALEGPGGVLRSEDQTAFRVKVRDRSGKILQGWLVFGKNWNPFSAPDELVDERWD